MRLLRKFHFNLALWSMATVHAFQGEDFSSIVGLRNVDIGSVHVYLESWPICTQ